MIEEYTTATMLSQFGFPVVVALVLLWDKIKTNGSLAKVVENNNIILKRIEGKLC